MDADDYLVNTMYEIMLDIVKRKEADLVCCSVYNIRSNKVIETYHAFAEEEVVNNNIYPAILMPLLTPGNGQAVLLQPIWNKLYHAKVIKENHIEFNEKLNYAEDWLFNICFFAKAKCVVFSKAILYYYDCSTMGTLSKRYRSNFFDEEVYLQKLLREYIPQFYVGKNFYLDILGVQCAALRHYVYFNGKKGFRQYIEKLINNDILIEAYFKAEQVPRKYIKAKKAICKNKKRKYISWANRQVYDVELKYLCKRLIKMVQRGV